LALTLAGLATAGCGGGSNPVTTAAAGSPSAAALPSAPAASAVSQVSIATAGTGSGKGISGAAAGTADIGASDAYLSSGQQTQSPELENIPLAVSAQQINVNLRGIHTLRLNGTVLAGIYQGTITNWDDQATAKINPGVTLPDLKIVPVRRSDSSGDTFLFTSYLSAQDPAWKSALAFGTTVAWPRVSGEISQGQQRHGQRLLGPPGLRGLHRYQLREQDQCGRARPGRAAERGG
jgi:phosphate ABC transporter phosphate-binding protein